MVSPFVRRRRLGAEIRALREERGMTADELARRIHQSRTKISKLENARASPDFAELMKILDILEVGGDRWHEIIRLARDAAEKGWWDSYGDAMGARQRMYADIESGAATIRGYYHVAIPGILQTEEFIRALIELDKVGGPPPYQPERMIQARLQRQRSALRPHGPACELILDEFLIRRLAVPAQTMSAQLLHLVGVASAQPRLRIRVLPIDARIEGGFSAKSAFTIYTFPDLDDPPLAIADTVTSDIVHADSEEVARYIELYDRLREACASPVRSLTLLEEAALRLADATGA